MRSAIFLLSLSFFLVSCDETPPTPPRPAGTLADVQNCQGFSTALRNACAEQFEGPISPVIDAVVVEARYVRPFSRAESSGGRLDLSIRNFNDNWIVTRLVVRIVDQQDALLLEFPVTRQWIEPNRTVTRSEQIDGRVPTELLVDRESWRLQVSRAYGIRRPAE